MQYSVDQGVATLTMDHVDNRNALTPELLTGLVDGLERAVADPAVRVIVVTNSGPAFCAGGDLKAGEAQASGEAPVYGLSDVLSLILDSPKPVVGRIAGHCMGGGVGLAAACDVSVAADDVLFGFNEVRIGMAPAIISVVVLPKLRRGDALELFLTGERIGAGRAAEVGVINRSVPSASLDAEVKAVVNLLVAGGPAALAASKQLVTEVPRLDRAAAFAWTAQRSAEMMDSEEGAEGIASFRDRRPPSWVANIAE
jgi:methylglutaconyl-CoA hydratase